MWGPHASGILFSGSDRGISDPDGGRHLLPDVRKLQQFLSVADKYVSTKKKKWLTMVYSVALGWHPSFLIE